MIWASNFSKLVRITITRLCGLFDTKFVLEQHTKYNTFSTPYNERRGHHKILSVFLLQKTIFGPERFYHVDLEHFAQLKFKHDNCYLTKDFS